MIEYLWIALCSLVAFLTWVYYSKNLSYWKKRKVPYEKPHALIGSALPILKGERNFSQVLIDLYKKFDEPYFGMHFFTTPFLVLKDPDLIKQVLIKDFNKFANRTFAADKDIDPVTFYTLVSMPTPDWKPLRSKLTPAFTSGKIKMMVPLINRCADDLVEYLDAQSGKEVEVKDLCVKYITDAIVSCAFGIDANSLKREKSEFYEAGRKIFSDDFKTNMSVLSYFVAPLLVQVFRLKFLNASAVDFLRKAFWETVDMREASKSRRNDMIDLLIDLRADEKSNEILKLNDDMMLAQAVTFFSAGQESMSSMMSFVLYELAANPVIQERLRNDIRGEIEKHGQLTYEAIMEMKYLDMVCHEVLRRYPATPMLSRENSEPYTFEKTGLVLEKRTSLIVPVAALHCDEKIYPEPQKFDPERFDEANKRRLIASGAYLPFGTGPRACIGDRFSMMGVKVGLVEVLKDFELKLHASTSVPLKINMKTNFLQTEGGIYVHFDKKY